MTSTQQTPRRFSAYDHDGGYNAAQWLTTEANARKWHAQHHPTCQLVGPTGLILAEASVPA